LAGILVLALPIGHADADRHAKPGVSDLERLFRNLLPQSLGRLDRAREVGIGKGRGEFLAAHPANDVGLAYDGAAPLRDRAQHFVAG
jgi:hypothetical protein